MVSRRTLLKLLGLLVFSGFIFKSNRKIIGNHSIQANGNSNNLGVHSDGFSHIFISKNGTPEQNTQKIIEMIGGIEKIIGKEDIVILKPNAQWWNQGTTNTNSMKAFIESILDIPNFNGEIIVAENHHFPEDNSRGWTTQNRNGDFNLNKLISYFNTRGFKNVTKYHWHDGGPSVQPSWGGAENGGLVRGPWEGEGYVWCHDLVYETPVGRKTLMNYPVFTSQYSGYTVDLKNGVWGKDKYLKKPLKLINFSALNHHGSGVGATASIKNYLGIIDMTCGFRGLKPKGFFNFHDIGHNFRKIPWKLEKFLRTLGWDPDMRYIGAAVGFFMHTIRMADLNIITAEWTGYGSRTKIHLRAHTRTILASKDPVALDYHATKYILLPATRKAPHGLPYIKLNDPDQSSPLRHFLEECQKQGIGTLDTSKMKVHSFDFRTSDQIR